MSAIQLVAPILPQFEAILRKALPNVELPENLVELMMATMSDGERNRLNECSFVKPSVDQINATNLKATLKYIPFDPSRVNYMIEDGRCPAIEHASGLFLPCCSKCSDGNTFCKTHLKKPSPYGAYEERKAKWEENLAKWESGEIEAIEPLRFTVEDKEVVEITYGQYLMKKQLTSETAKKAIKDAGLAIKLQSYDLRVPNMVKKARGRPSDKKVKAVGDELDENSEESKKTEEPKKTTRVKLSDDEKASRAAARDEKKEIVRIRKEQEAEAKAAQLLNRAETSTEKPRTKPKLARAVSPSVSPERIGTSMDTIYFNGELSDLLEREDNGESVWCDADGNVYNADKKKIGTINEAGDEIVRN